MSVAANSSIDLSDLDRALIAALQADGRASYADLARVLEVPQRRVAQRIRELRDADVIRLTMLADPAIYGYQRPAMVALNIAGRPPSKVAEDLVRLESVDYVIIAAGRYDIFVEILCRNLTELRDDLEIRVRGIDGVHALEVLPLLRMHHVDPTATTLAHGAPAMTQSHDQSIDSVDQQIVAALSEDGRRPLHTVGERIGVSEANVRRRIKRLRDAGMARVIALTNPFNLGFAEIAMLQVVLSAGGRASAVARALAEVEGVTYVATCAGRFDILAEVMCTDATALEALLDDRIRQVEGIARVEACVYMGLHVKSVGPPSH